MPGIDLLQFARDNRLRRHARAVGEWLDDLDTSKEGGDFKRHLTHDVALPRAPAARSLLRSLITQIGTDWHISTPRQPAVEWLMGLLEAHAATFLCQGKAVPDDAATDTLCRTTSLRSVYERMRPGRRRKGRPAGALAAGTVAPIDTGRLRAWGHKFLENPRLTWTEIDPAAPVRGRLPLIFACPEQDRRSAWAPGTSVRRIIEVLGLGDSSATAVDQCVMTFRQSAAGTGHVPSALDAGPHPYFLPPRWNARWGTTCDLQWPENERHPGVRECVVPAFQAHLLAQFDVIDA